RLSQFPRDAVVEQAALHRDRRPFLTTRNIAWRHVMTSSPRTGPQRRRTLLAVAFASAALVLAGCGTSSGGDSSGAAPGANGFTPADLPMKTSIGDGEGELNVLAWPGYAEDGSTSKKVDWVTPFEEQTGCQVNVKDFGTSDEAVSLMAKGGYDVVSASG